MADRVLRLRKKAIITVNIWVVSFILLLLCAQFPFYILASQNFRSNVLYWVTIIVDVWCAILASVALFNLVAFVQMTKLRRSRTITSRNDDEADGTRKKMDMIICRIQKTTSCIIILDVVLMALIWYQLPYFERTIYSDPRCFVDQHALALRFSVIFWLLLFLTAIWFIAPSVLKRSRIVVNDTTSAIDISVHERQLHSV